MRQGEYQPKDQVAMQRFFNALEALPLEDRQAAVFSLVSGALKGADDEDTLCEAVCSSLDAVGLVMFVVRPGQSRLLGVTDPTFEDETVKERVALVIDHAMRAIRSTVSKAIDEREKAGGNGG